MTADQLAINSSASTVNDKTWSAMAVDARLNTLLTAVDQWGTALRNGVAANKKAYTNAFGATGRTGRRPWTRTSTTLRRRSMRRSRTQRFGLVGRRS